jgi:peptide chain release factor 2
MLYHLYRQWADTQQFNMTVVDEHVNEEIGGTGYRSVTLRVKGNMAYGWMKAEAGVHRLVRISPFDPMNKRHTTFAQVLVYPELVDTATSIINPKDLRIDTFRSSGAGGQSVQKTDSAVRITHLPTGLVVSCQNERSQHQNRATAMSILKSRLDQLNREKQYSQKNQTTIGGGDISWGNQIRSVVMQPYQMVKDHRTGWETGNVEAFMRGELLSDAMTTTLKYLAEAKE